MANIVERAPLRPRLPSLARAAAQAVGSKTLHLLGGQQGRSATAATYLYFVLDAVARATAVALLFGLPSGGAALGAATAGLFLLDLGLQAWLGPNGASIPAAVLSLFSAFPLTTDPGDRSRLCATATAGTVAVAVAVLALGAPVASKPGPGTEIFGNASSGSGSGNISTLGDENTEIDPAFAAVVCLAAAGAKLLVYLGWVRQLTPGESATSASGVGSVFALGVAEGDQMAGWNATGEAVRCGARLAMFGSPPATGDAALRCERLDSTA